MITPTTQREEFIGELKEALAANPSNRAIAHHLAKVEAMNEEQWKEHRIYLLTKGEQFRSIVSRLAADIIACCQRPTKEDIACR